MDNKILQLLGLARRGGKIVLGESNLPLLAKSKPILIFVANDASDNTKKRWKDKCTYYNKEYVVFASKNDFKLYLGLGNVSVLGLTEPNLIVKVQELLKDGDYNGTK